MNVNVDLMEENVAWINGGITINVNKTVKKRLVCGKDYIWNPSTCSSENGKYLANIMDGSAINCDEMIYAEVKSNDKIMRKI